MGRGEFLEAVADDEHAAGAFVDRPRRGSERQRRDRNREARRDQAPRPSRHRRVCSALGRRCRVAPLAAAALALALALPACGGEAPAAPQPTDATLTAPSAEPPAGAKPAAIAATPCARALGGFLDQLEHLRRSLVIGVSYEQYVAELGTVRAAYRRVPVGELDLACVAGPASAAERSFDGYLAAANAWGECVSEAGCETATLEPRLQREWRAAARQLAAARRGLAG
ncbi:MAG: hypothetical protein AB7V58_11250 [Solirubrobacterales bacterium]